jgi:hypothetical protein
MAKFDVSKIIVTRSSNIMDRRPEEGLYSLLHWLDENVGTYDGTNFVNRSGDGWQITKLWNGSRNRPEEWQMSIVSYELDITDEAKATLFALKWMK